MIQALILLFALATPSFEQKTRQVTPPSPCPGVFEYEPVTIDPSAPPTRWYGKFILTTESTLNFIWVNIQLDGKGDILGTSSGEVTTRDNQNYRIQITDTINPGDMVPVRFFVKFSPVKPGGQIPRLQAIRVNSRVICDTNALHETTQSILPPATNRSLVGNSEATYPELTLGAPQNPTNPPKMANTPIDVEVQTEHIPLIIFGGFRPTVLIPDNKIKCGTVASQAVPLVVNGSPTQDGQWPWQIALFRHVESETRFICGGTLVSHLHVITAAHCVTYQNTKTVVDKNIFSVTLGVRNLKTSVRGVQKRKLESIKVHPDYNPNTLNRDAAIMQLDTRVPYTDWVRPACLWPDTLVDLKNVVGRSGSAVGWGYDDTNMVTDELMVVQMPVVETQICLETYDSSLSHFVSEYTYCAGYRNGSSVCNGDSGGGMVFKIDGFWHLRGLVTLSAGIRSDDQLVCDATKYVVFTDLAKLLPWIRDNVYDL